MRSTKLSPCTSEALTLTDTYKRPPGSSRRMKATLRLSITWNSCDSSSAPIAGRKRPGATRVSPRASLANASKPATRPLLRA